MNGPEQLTLGILIAACLLMSAFFSGSETALMRLRLPRKDSQDGGESSVEQLTTRVLLRNIPRLLVTLLLGNNLVNILAASAASILVVGWLGPEKGILASTLGLTIIVLIFCELLPKSIAARHPGRIAYWASMPMYVLHKALTPLHWALGRAIDPLVDRMGTEPEESKDQALLSEALEASTGKPGTRAIDIMGSAARASQTTVREIMTPRTEIFAFPEQTSAKEALRKMTRSRYSRALIHDGDIDSVEGCCHLKDVAKASGCAKSKTLKSLCKDVLHVPESKPVLDLLGEMQESAIHMAVVKDEFGTTEGICTQEDILEEIVGEIWDEFDREEQRAIRKTQDNTYQAPGHAKVLDLNRKSGWEIQAEKGETIAGLVLRALGHMPKPGERVEQDGYLFQIKAVEKDRERITRIRVSRLSSA